MSMNDLHCPLQNPPCPGTCVQQKTAVQRGGSCRKTTKSLGLGRGKTKAHLTCMQSSHMSVRDQGLHTCTLSLVIAIYQADENTDSFYCRVNGRMSKRQLKAYYGTAFRVIQFSLWTCFWLSSHPLVFIQYWGSAEIELCKMSKVVSYLTVAKSAGQRPLFFFLCSIQAIFLFHLKTSFQFPLHLVSVLKEDIVASFFHTKQFDHSNYIVQ